MAPARSRAPRRARPRRRIACETYPAYLDPPNPLPRAPGSPECEPNSDFVERCRGRRGLARLALQAHFALRVGAAPDEVAAPQCGHLPAHGLRRRLLQRQVALVRPVGQGRRVHRQQQRVPRRAVPALVRDVHADVRGLGRVVRIVGEAGRLPVQRRLHAQGVPDLLRPLRHDVHGLVARLRRMDRVGAVRRECARRPQIAQLPAATAAAADARRSLGSQTPTSC